MQPPAPERHRDDAAPASPASPGGDIALLGGAFVLVWCTGYIAGKFMVAHAGALTSLVWRFGLAAAVFAALALAAGRWRASRADWWHSGVTGVLMLALQFGGVYVGLQLGATAGVAALVIGAMPLAVALLATSTGSGRLRGAQWAGLALGFAGVAAVVADRIDGATPAWAWVALVAGLAGISGGTLYQKRFASAVDLRAGLAIQNLAATVVLLPFALVLEGFRYEANAGFAWPLAWTVVVNSVGGFALLFLLIRRGAATAVSALFFLVPPVTAVFGHALLGEHLTWLKGAGFALAAVGTWLATRRPR